MAVLNLTLGCEDGRLDRETAASFRSDVERSVGAVGAGGPPEPGAKGIAEAATIAVAILSTQAVTQLVGVLKSYFERDRSLEVEVAVGEWRVRLKGGDARRMTAFEIEKLIERAMAAGKGETGDAPGDPGRL